jgi:glycosyltransferase involved in cell wall biosynthesis
MMSQVSVIICAFNAAKTLEETLNSVANQTLAATEIILVNDGSTDTTVEVAKKFPQVTVVNQIHKGVGTAINNGLSRATSEFIAFIDSDDLWTPNCLELQMTTLKANPQASGSVGWLEEFICPSLTADQASRFKIRESQIAWVNGATLIRRSLYEKIGKLNTELTIGEWIDWISRAKNSKHQFVTHESIILKRRLHPSSLSIQRKKNPRDGMLDVVRLALERKKATK